MRFLRYLPVLLLLAACSSVKMPEVASFITPYRIDINQGNYVTQEMVAQLKPGMTRDQVRFVLGTPLVADVFHADRWDYVYRFTPGRGETQSRHFSIFFADNKLARVAGDVIAAEPGAAGADAAAVTGAQAKVIEIGGPEEKNKAADDQRKPAEAKPEAQ